MSEVAEAIHSYQNRMEGIAHREAELTYWRIEQVLFSAIRKQWDREDLEDQESRGARWVLAKLCEDFDLEEALLDHDEGEAYKYLGSGLK